MATDIATAVITASGAVALTAASYFFTKLRERESELRKEKLDHYKDFVRSLSGIVEGDETPTGHQAFAVTSNNLNLIAPQRVIKALQAYREEISIKNKQRSSERHDQLLTDLFLEIRRDLNIKPKDDAATSRFALWTSGHPRPADQSLTSTEAP